LSFFGLTRSVRSVQTSARKKETENKTNRRKSVHSISFRAKKIKQESKQNPLSI